MKDIFTPFQPLHLIAVTDDTAKKLQPLAKEIGGNLWLPKKLINNDLTNNYYDGSLKEHLENIWQDSKAIIFSLTMGAVVRLVSSLLGNKKDDPAIIVIDPDGNYVISLLGGHQAFADKLTELVALQLDAQPIVTSASQSLGIIPIDTFGHIFGWVKGEGDWTRVSASLARKNPVKVVQNSGSFLWQKSLQDNHSFVFDNDNKHCEELIYIGIEKNINKQIENFRKDAETKGVVRWFPRVLWVGIGCERNTPRELIEYAIREVFERFNLDIKAIALICTIDIKGDEVGILELTQDWQLELKTFEAQELDGVRVPNPSAVVKEEVGTSSVAEAAALKGASLPTLGEEETPRLIVPKQIVKREGVKGAVTVAVAQSALEYNPHHGKLYLVGTGTGSLSQMTTAAKTAVKDADVVIGYGLYLDLIKPLFRPEQIIESFPITQERQRAIRAIALSRWGLKVAVVSSGDCGIFGMGGLVLEILAQTGWNGKTPSVEVFAGITAMQGGAAKVGSPLMHDFCAISLSDLLTPWEVIEKRLNAAAQADFVTSLYNPRSKTRTQQIVIAQQIFLKYRSGDTPVAIARSITRDDEHITITTLREMLNYDIDMLTTVIIGNSTTKAYQGFLITPRGYLNN
ncbi:precorrin-3 methyltransferase [Cyanobacterium stanieri PCC 7202]|uniref:Precorrin-3 methyltransferase n=1 Tax=Cyanobacterium stanieri (strain ATCC 29140 / PCC 7202) TaxID=292563 RepID=K9YNF9_CYASC|nr:precorrin-3 methyltransferase [Cyanobacterium stanieri PCC 7202]